MKQEQTRFAPAKLNLTLDILRRRSDGYHDLQMVMQSISLRDTVTVRTGTGGDGIAVATDRLDLPGGPKNIAWQAARAFYEATGLPNQGTEIFIEKKIPMEAGMAGGSADGAAVLRALQAMLCPDLPDWELEAIAGSVGSDLPFCVRGGTALAEGRGERLTTLPPLPECHIVLCKPDFGISTPVLFRRVQVETLTRRPDLAAMRRALEEKNVPAVAKQLRNVFEDLLTEEEKEIFSIKALLRQQGALNACMTGSGTTVFGLFTEKAIAQQAEKALKMKYSQVFLVKPLSN
ncbi:MAG: 4-(cytidine 5'-diphospho)-2-C-methyl-D-erythritol kinase [Oscillibacter sp.]